MRIMYDDLIHKSASMGAPGVEEVKWLKPVRPDDTLTARWNVLETRLSRSRPGMGLARMRVVLFNQRDEMVYDMSYWQMVGRRGASPHQCAGGPTRAKASNGEPAATPEVREIAVGSYRPAVDAAGFFEDLVVGETSAVGDYRFTAENIIRFAKAFDPQPFHVDPAGGGEKPFRRPVRFGLAHWLRLHAQAHRPTQRRSAKGSRQKGMKPPAMGSSPGFRNLVLAQTGLCRRRRSASRQRWCRSARAPRGRGWGLIFSRNTGTNQKGELVYEFTGSVFIERRP